MKANSKLKKSDFELVFKIALFKSILVFRFSLIDASSSKKVQIKLFNFESCLKMEKSSALSI